MLYYLTNGVKRFLLRLRKKYCILEMQSGGGVMNVFGNKIKRLREEKKVKKIKKVSLLQKISCRLKE